MMSANARYSSIVAASVYGLGGIGFAVGNLLLAKALPVSEYAWVALILALGQVAYTVGPLGTNTLVVRYPVNPDGQLLRRTLLSSAAASLLIGLVSWAVYRFSGSIALVAVAVFFASAANLVGASVFRSRGRFAAALAHTQIQNVAIVIASAAAIYRPDYGAMLPLSLIALTVLSSAFVAWFRAFRLVRIADATDTAALPWKEGLAIVFTALAVTALVQLERLAVPKLLDHDALATFAVLASIAGSPFRLLQMAVNFTLVPRLRDASGADERRSIVQFESLVAAAAAAGAAVLVWKFAGPFTDWFFEGRYHLGANLVGAALLAGVAKVISALSSSSVTALGNMQELKRLGQVSWTALVIGLVGGVIGSRYGLTGIVLGVTSGWIYLAVAASVLSRRYFRSA